MTTPQTPRTAAGCDDEFDALARQMHDSIAEGQTIEETAKALRILAAPYPEARAGGLDVERRVTEVGVALLATAMDEAYEYVEDYVPALPFVDDHEGFWRPFAAKVFARLTAEEGP